MKIIEGEPFCVSAEPEGCDPPSLWLTCEVRHRSDGLDGTMGLRAFLTAAEAFRAKHAACEASFDDGVG